MKVFRINGVYYKLGSHIDSITTDVGYRTEGTFECKPFEHRLDHWYQIDLNGTMTIHLNGYYSEEYKLLELKKFIIGDV